MEGPEPHDAFVEQHDCDHSFPLNYNDSIPDNELGNMNVDDERRVDLEAECALNRVKVDPAILFVVGNADRDGSEPFPAAQSGQDYDKAFISQYPFSSNPFASNPF